MASKKKRKPNNYNGSGMLSINKARTSIFTKVILIILAVVLIGGTSSGVYFLLTQSNDGTASGASTKDAIDAQYSDTAAAARQQLAVNTDDADTWTQLGNTLFDWANALEGLQNSDAETQQAIAEHWKDAASAYEKAIAFSKKDVSEEVLGDYTFALLASGETTKAVEAGKSATEQEPKYAMAWFGLARAYEATGQNAEAITAYKKYLELDPSNTYKNHDFANQQIAALEA